MVAKSDIKPVCLGINFHALKHNFEAKIMDFLAIFFKLYLS